MSETDNEPRQNRVFEPRARVAIDDVPLLEGIRLPARNVQRSRNRALYLLEAGFRQARARGLLAADSPKRDEFMRELFGAARRVGAEITDKGLAKAARAREKGNEASAVEILFDLMTGELTAPKSTFPDLPANEQPDPPLGMTDDRRLQVEYDLVATTRQLLRKARRGMAPAEDVSRAVGFLGRPELELVHHADELNQLRRELKTGANRPAR